MSLVVHYNQIDYTACFMPKDNVYVTNKTQNVTCVRCKDFIKNRNEK